MAVCEVCGANCRGKCAKCGARLCAGCKPKSARAKCKICSMQKHGHYGRQAQAQQRPTRSQHPGQAHLQNVTTAYYTPRVKPDFENMSNGERLAFIYGCKGRLEAKRVRERAYLDRRAARGTRTPTDEAYEQDQLLEFDLLDLLDFLAQIDQER